MSTPSLNSRPATTTCSGTTRMPRSATTEDGRYAVVSVTIATLTGAGYRSTPLRLCTHRAAHGRVVRTHGRLSGHEVARGGQAGTTLTSFGARTMTVRTPFSVAATTF